MHYNTYNLHNVFSCFNNINMNICESLWRHIKNGIYSCLIPDEVMNTNTIDDDIETGLCNYYNDNYKIDFDNSEEIELELSNLNLELVRILNVVKDYELGDRIRMTKTGQPKLSRFNALDIAITNDEKMAIKHIVDITQRTLITEDDNINYFDDDFINGLLNIQQTYNGSTECALMINSLLKMIENNI